MQKLQNKIVEQIDKNINSIDVDINDPDTVKNLAVLNRMVVLKDNIIRNEMDEKKFILDKDKLALEEKKFKETNDISKNKSIKEIEKIDSDIKNANEKVILDIEKFKYEKEKDDKDFKLKQDEFEYNKILQGEKLKLETDKFTSDASCELQKIAIDKERLAFDRFKMQKDNDLAVKIAENNFKLEEMKIDLEREKLIKEYEFRNLELKLKIEQDKENNRFKLYFESGKEGLTIVIGIIKFAGLWKMFKILTKLIYKDGGLLDSSAKDWLKILMNLMKL